MLAEVNTAIGTKSSKEEGNKGNERAEGSGLVFAERGKHDYEDREKHEECLRMSGRERMPVMHAYTFNDDLLKSGIVAKNGHRPGHIEAMLKHLYQSCSSYFRNRIVSEHTVASAEEQERNQVEGPLGKIGDGPHTPIEERGMKAIEPEMQLGLRHQQKRHQHGEKKQEIARKIGNRLLHAHNLAK